jgi:hypothetical protein
MGVQNTDIVLKAYRTEADAINDANPLYVNSSSDIEVTNEAQSHSNFAGIGFYTYSKYYFRIEANEAVKEFYIDWNDGEDASLQKANYSLLKFNDPVFSAVTSHVFTQNKQHYPKIRVKSKQGLWSKLYTPNGADVTGWEVLAQGESLTAGQNEFATVSFDATGSNARIPIFTPAEKAPIAILKADKNKVFAGINQLPLMGIDNDFDGETVTIQCSNVNRSAAKVDITYHDLTSDQILTVSKVCYDRSGSVANAEKITNVGKILAVRLQNLKEASTYGGSTTTDSLAPGERMWLESGSSSVMKVICEVSQGNPIVMADDPDTVVTYDSSSSFARSSNVSVTNYWLDGGQYSKLYTPITATTWNDIQSEDSSFNHISDTMADGTNNILYSKTALKEVTYNLNPYEHIVDADRRYYPQGRLARLQVGTDKSLSLDSDGDTIQKSYIEHFRYDYYDKDAQTHATSGKNRPADQRSSNLLAYKNTTSAPVGWLDLSSRNVSVTDNLLEDKGSTDGSLANYMMAGTDIDTVGTNYLIMARDKPWDAMFWDLDFDGLSNGIGSTYSTQFRDFVGNTSSSLGRAQFKVDVYYSAPLLGAGAIDGEDTKVWKPLKFLDKTKLYDVNDGKVSDDKLHTTWWRSGSWEWDIPSDWEKVDPANIADRYYPTGSYDGRTYEESRLYLFAFNDNATQKTVGSVSSGKYVTTASHGLSVGDKVTFQSTGNMPTSTGSITTIEPDTVYFVAAVSGADQFTIAPTDGGTAAVAAGVGTGTVTLFIRDGALDAMMAGIQSKYTTLGNPVSHNIWLDVESGGSNPSVAGDDLEVDISKTDSNGVNAKNYLKSNFLDCFPRSALQSNYILIDDVRTSTFGTSTDYYVWLNIDGAGSDPSVAGRTGVAATTTSFAGGGVSNAVSGPQVISAFRSAISGINGLTVDAGVSSFVRGDVSPETNPIGQNAMYGNVTLTDNMNWPTSSSGINARGAYLSANNTDAYPSGGGLTAEATNMKVLYLRYETGMQLSADITSTTATTISVTNASKYNSSGQVIMINNEYMLIGGRDTSANTLTVSRGHGSTSAATHSTGDKAPYFYNSMPSSGPRGIVAGGMYKIDNEIVRVTAIDSSGGATIERGKAFTTAATHGDANLVTQVAAPDTDAVNNGPLSATSLTKNYLVYTYDYKFIPAAPDIGNLDAGVVGLAAGFFHAAHTTGRDTDIVGDDILTAIATKVNADSDFTASAVTGTAKRTTLAEDIDTSETEIDVASGEGDLFAVGDVVQCGTEYMKISGIDGDTLTVSRGHFSSSAVAKSSGEFVWTKYVTMKAASKGAATDIGTTENLPANFKYDTLNQGSDVSATAFAYDATVSADWFNNDDRWNNSYKKYALMMIISTDCGASYASTACSKRHIRHVWPFSNSHSQYVEVHDPMHVSLNDISVAQSVSIKRLGKFHAVEDRRGMVDLEKIGSSSGVITLGGVDMSSDTGRNKMFKFYRDSTPVYYDLEHDDGGEDGNSRTRLFGIITQMAEDFPTAKMTKKYSVTMQVTKILTYNGTTGAILSRNSNYTALGGQDKNVADYS